MNEDLKVELQELQNLEGAGSLDDSQKSRLTVLRVAEQAEKTVEEKSKELASALAQKEHFRTKFETTETELKTLRLKPNDAPANSSSLSVEQFIDISTSLEGLDPREKEYAATLHTLSKKPLKEVVKDENFLLWQGAYRAKVEKEKQNIPPNSRQPEGDVTISLEQALAEAKTPAEREKILGDAGLLPAFSGARSDRVVIGNSRNI